MPEIFITVKFKELKFEVNSVMFVVMEVYFIIMMELVNWIISATDLFNFLVVLSVEFIFFTIMLMDPRGY